MAEHNELQRNFFVHVADAQESCIQVALSKYKAGDDIENLLYDVTSDIIADVMTIIDEYSKFSEEAMDIVNPRTGIGIKQNPFI